MEKDQKLLFNELKILSKKINTEMFKFFDFYHDYFVHKQKVESDKFVNFNFEVVEFQKTLKDWIEKTNFVFQYKEFNQENVDKIYYDVLNKHIYDLESYHLSEDFDCFYYPYLLFELYILLPYVMYEFLLQNEIKTSDGIEKKKYKLLTQTLTYSLGKNVKVFREWDMLDNKVKQLPFDKDELCHSSKKTYYGIHEQFSDLMNQYYVLRTRWDDAFKAITMHDFISNKWWVFIIVGVLIIGIILSILGIAKVI